jgi:two-component system cell cycle response regulator
MKVLAVDDSRLYRLMIERALTALGHQCIVVEDGLAAWRLLERESFDVVISDWVMPGMDGEELCRRIRDAPDERPYVYFAMLTSLEDRAHVLRGMKAGVDDYLSKPLDSEELEACLIAAERVTRLHRKLAEQQLELEHLNRSLYEQSRHDALTGVGNRLRMDEDLAAIEANAERDGRAYAVALCDVDHFKAFNDSRGHQAGDEVLRAVAGALRDNGRRGDAIFRYGGEELLAVLPVEDRSLALAAAERLRAAVEELAIPHPQGGPVPLVTISVGVALREAGHQGGPAALLRHADEALYRAKDAGRNRVEIGPPSGEEPAPEPELGTGDRHSQ